MKCSSFIDAALVVKDTTKPERERALLIRRYVQLSALPRGTLQREEQARARAGDANVDWKEGREGPDSLIVQL